MSSDLVAITIFDIRDEYADFARGLDDFRVAHSHEITGGTYLQLEGWSKQIKDYVFNLTRKGIQTLKTDLDNAGEKIKKAVQKMNKALKTITDFNKILGKIADAVTIIGEITKAVISGLLSVNLDSLFTSLESLIT
jgi:5-bromo-4-chloroindolyl phosphate hydrolysis protein